MKSKHTKSAIRAVGQRSISSTLLFRTQPPNQIRPEDAKEGAKSGPPPKRVSFSDYLNRKLQSNSVLPRAFQRDRNKAIEGPNQPERSGQQRGTNGVIEASIFKQFNLANGGQESEPSNAIHANDDEIEVLNTDNAMPGSRKRRNAFEGDERSTVRSHLLILGDDVTIRKDTSANKRSKQLCNEGNIESNQTQHTIKKHVVVLGDDPKPKRGGVHGQSSFSSKQPKPQYNHYENGAGWWDYEREGVDNDEVGTNEVWEGMGSTTLGEIVDWH